MALQSTDLVMVGLGVLGDMPPNGLQPPLVNGIHLRWAFKHELGFPRHGFYLFRRWHRKAQPICLSPATGGLPIGTWPGTALAIPARGRFRSDRNLRLTNDFPPSGFLEFDLADRSSLRFTFPEGEPAFSVEVRIGFRDLGEIKVTALFGDIPVTQAVVAGRAGAIVTTTLEFDAITDLAFSAGPAALVDLCFHPVLRDAAAGWEPIPHFPYPMCLPVIHPDYPCTLGLSEDLAAARAKATGRVRYGDPNQFTSSPVPLDTVGTISVVNGSPIVRGSGTDWRGDLVGAVLQISGDPTAYTILMVVTPDKLVLSRGYVGATSTEAAYAIRQDDAFGQLHDYLIHLVSGSIALGPMASRSLPGPIVATGTISVFHGLPVVVGIGTDWSDNLTGLALQVVELVTGTISVNHGSPIVTGTGTSWSSDLAGLTLKLAAERTEYTIAAVDSATQLTLEREYEGSKDVGNAYSVYEKTLYTIVSVDSPTELTIDRGYARSTKEFGSEKAYTISATLQPTEPARAAPRVANQYPLDLVLLGTLQPALAQMIGLYWVDQQVDPRVAFDYLVLADYEGLFSELFSEMSPPSIVKLLHDTGFDDKDGYIVFNKKMAPAPKLSAPGDPRVYALPGGFRTTQDGALQDAGLRWELGVTDQGVLLPDKSVMYHLWRANLGASEPPNAPPASQYGLITVSQEPTTGPKPRPILVARPSEEEPQRPPNWPPCPLHALDEALPDGWYSYQMSGIDLFGRHSPRSAPAAWYQWKPVPDPSPWYYKEPPANRAIHSFAVRLLDRIAPPPPTGIEAYALDPDDPLVLKNAAYNAWREANSEQVGLRVCWLWTRAYMRQAPDTHEFRLYYHPGRMNALLGHTLDVSEVTDPESEVETDIPNAHPANVYVGARLQIGPDAFVIVASDADDPLRVRVKNSGPGKDIRPKANAPCTLAIPSDRTAGRISVLEGSPTVIGTGTGWRAALAGRTLKIVGESAEYTIIGVDADTQVVTLDRDYDGITDTARAYAIRHPLFVNYREATNWDRRLYVVDYEEHWVPAADGDGRHYEVFLPAPDTGEDEAFAPSLANPILYADVGVSATDDKTHTLDDPKWDAGDWGERFGNEGRVGAPAKIFRVLRKPPAPPTTPPPDSDKVFATPADYHSLSFYTYRWQPQQHLKTHIFRALDDAVFKVDWSQRPRPALDPDDPADLDFFPSEADEPNWNADKRRQVADELNPLNTFTDDAEGTAQAMAYYQELSNDALRVLAGLPDNEPAFTQLTIQPLDRDDPDNANRKTPADPDDFEIGDSDNPLASETLRIYIDTLDGRSTNRYLYRAAYVDEVHNRSQLSLSSPPIYLPNVVPPRTPVMTKVLGGDRRITLRWASNREPDLVEYRVYRADSKDKARDLRLMSLVHTEPVTPDDPAVRPAEVAWIDAPLPGLKTFSYRLVVEDKAGNVSRPTPAILGRALDESLPIPPALTVTWTDVGSGTIHAQAAWTSVDESVLQRRKKNAGLWTSITDLLPPGSHRLIDADSDSAQSYQYRLRVRKETGATAIGDSVTLAAMS